MRDLMDGEVRRIQPGDALALMRDDLLRWAGQLTTDDRQGQRWWSESVVDLLIHVPCPAQRAAWCLELCQAAPGVLVYDEALASVLLSWVEEIRRCRAL